MSVKGTRNDQSAQLANLERLMDDQVLSFEPLHGGDLSLVTRVRLSSGRSYVVKSGPYPNREGRMLQKLADAGARVPRPICSSTDVLLLEDLGSAGRPTDRAWYEFGVNLRGVHKVLAERFGWTEDYAFANLRIHNGRAENWADFWIEKRLLADSDKLPDPISKSLEELRPRLIDVLPSRPDPSLLHGDLWSGNIHFTKAGDAYLIDPASYFGHAEVDLAMLTFFDSPPIAFWDGYGPLEEGWQLRRHAYQLWPALVHLRLFGMAYSSLVDGLIAKLLR